MEDVQVKRLVKRGRVKTVDYDVYKRPIMELNDMITIIFVIKDSTKR